MLIKLRDGQIFPSMDLTNKDIIEVRAVANWKDNGVNCTLFLENKQDLDKVPDFCNNVSVMFSDGAYVELPIKAFRELFKVIPQGDLTDAIYGNK